jgi:hypothetical protein
MTKLRQEIDLQLFARPEKLSPPHSSPRTATWRGRRWATTAFGFSTADASAIFVAVVLVGAGPRPGVAVVGKLLGYATAHLDAEPLRHAAKTISDTISAAIESR